MPQSRLHARLRKNRTAPITTRTMMTISQIDMGMHLLGATGELYDYLNRHLVGVAGFSPLPSKSAGLVYFAAIAFARAPAPRLRDTYCKLLRRIVGSLLI
jgi:hypothetical protein